MNSHLLCLWAHWFITSYVWSMQTCHPSVASFILLYTLVWRTPLPKFILYCIGVPTKTACLKLTAKDLWSFCWPFDSHLLHIIWAFPAFQNDWKLYLHQIWMDFTGQGFWLKKCITVHCPYNLLLSHWHSITGIWALLGWWQQSLLHLPHICFSFGCPLTPPNN